MDEPWIHENCSAARPVFIPSTATATAHEPTSCCTSIGLAAPCRHLGARRPTCRRQASSWAHGQLHRLPHQCPHPHTHYSVHIYILHTTTYPPGLCSVRTMMDCGPWTGGLVALRPSPPIPLSQTASPSTKSHDLPDAAFLQFHFLPLPRPCCSFSPSSSSPPPLPPISP